MQDLELSLFLVVAIATAAWLWWITAALGKVRWLLTGAPLLCLSAAIVWLPPDRSLQELKQEVPTIGRAGFTGSDQCRSCHIPHYDSWHRSYHRTMTQLASEESIQAPFDGRELVSKDGRHKVDRQGPWFTAELVDPDWEASQYKEGIEIGQTTDAPRVRLPIVMTTGSHHLQAYWVPSEHGNKVRIFPWVYHIDSERWIPNGDSFILPPHSKRYGQVWNNSCILCHSVAGDVGHDPGNWRTQVAELGISCEACHGAGEEHVRKHRNPATRYMQHHSDQADPTIVNPARLAHTKSSEICGQCHSALDDETSIPYNQYRAGDDFQSLFHLANPHNSQDVRFWGDGTIRVGGREYNSLIESACFQQGQLSCISCHSMHGGPPDKQLAPDMAGNQACVQCHSKIADDITAHTHHAVDSSGSLCYNCHMPHTSYALFNAIRSHRIDSPSVKNSVQTGRPNACNQCHLDQTLAWTNRHLKSWYGIEPAVLSEEQQTYAAAVLWLLKGDAVQRVMAAWCFRWQPAMEASGLSDTKESWHTAFLARLLEDPYSMVRYNAAESLKKLGQELKDYDYLQSPEDRPSFMQGQLTPTPKMLDHSGLKAFCDERGAIKQEIIENLLKQRNDQPVTLYE